jgi:hypothetical protein
LNIPSTLRAGDTIEWDEVVTDYPASDGYTLAFVLSRYGQSLITITAAADGDDYAITILPAVTRLWVAGIYSWMAYVYKTGGTPVVITEKYTLEHGQVTILPDITQATTASDLRSVAKKTLDEIETVIQAKAANGDISGYSIAGRSATKYSWEEIIKMRSFFLEEYRRECEAEDIARGLDSPRRIGVRFRRL